jgi:hypothetical protein
MVSHSLVDARKKDSPCELPEVLGHSQAPLLLPAHSALQARL